MSAPRNRNLVKAPNIPRNLLFSLPDHLLTTIFKVVGRDGFEYLGPLLATGKISMTVVLRDEVLKEACLQTLLNSPALVNRWSKYYRFFARCVVAGNVEACYLESLRLTTKEGKIDEAIELLLKTAPLSEEMEFALAIFLINRGHYTLGMQWMDSFKMRVGSYESSESVAELVFDRIREIGPVRLPRDVSPPYCSTWKFYKVPKCAAAGYHSSDENRCEECFAWGCSIQFYWMFL